MLIEPIGLSHSCTTIGAILGLPAALMYVYGDDCWPYYYKNCAIVILMSML